MKPAPVYSFPMRSGCWEFDGKGHVREVEPEPIRDPAVDVIIARWDGVTITLRPPPAKTP